MNENLKGHFLNLYMVALTDFRFDEKELETILKIGEEKGITEDEFEKIIINPTSINIIIPTDFRTQINLLFDFARVIWSDGKVADEEEIIFMNFCRKFGFENAESEELFAWLIGLAKNNATSDDLEKEINNLLN